MATPGHIVNQTSETAQWTLDISSYFGRFDPMYTFNKKALSRKSEITKIIKGDCSLKFGINEEFPGVLDSYHGDPSFHMQDESKRAVTRAMEDIQEDRMWKFVESDGSYYARANPKILRELAAEKLFHILDHPHPQVPGIKVPPSDVLVYPYSDTCVIEKVLASVSKSKGVILSPAGFYKNNSKLAFNAGLKIVAIPIDLQTGKMDFDEMDRLLQLYTHQGTLCCFLMTIPGNPLVVEYTVEELQRIGCAVLKYQVPTVVDSIFFSSAPADKAIQLAAVEVEFEGKTVLMHDHVVTTSGNSKGPRASGPSKIGALCTGNGVWREKLALLMSCPVIQRETTHIARATLEFCTLEFYDRCCENMMAQQVKARKLIADLNEKYGERSISVVGPSTYSMFMAIALSDDLCKKAGIVDSWQLEDFFLAVGGLDSVSFAFFGCDDVFAIRLNTLCPERNGYKKEENVVEMFSRIDGILNYIVNGGTYEQALQKLGVESTISIAGLPR
eukprot:CAMPEP_0115028182 /NCGR_PEP_ID=MMETSP0216-20121206/36078_1 /TAXON_ID=223996 /ORGANISM="Protocruzia adherens, Strain Boccale" /LENGTH=500 /DNA_ID=CAMNT_0002404177 /DNA_START=57 /DNA_END=1559 /DNA_ORIENTATION=-